MSILVSVITPCFNHGLYLDDAMQSIPYDKLEYEVEHIIVNDGSTDEYTIQKFKEINSPHVKIIHQQNAGLSAARNAGISIAKGKYIIPLDADNKLHENYFTKAIDILEDNISVSVVYGNMHVFGKETWINQPGKINMARLLTENYIDACAVFRKKAFEQFGMYDTNMLQGYEDWELWLNFFFKGAEFKYFNDVGFFYRITDKSMLRSISIPKFAELRSYILRKYSIEIVDYFIKHQRDLQIEITRYRNAEKNRVKSILKLIFKKAL